jgi:hypothetical protein
MVEKMKKGVIRRVTRMLATWPMIGRFVTVAVAVVRLPEMRAALLDQKYRQHVFESEQLPRLVQTISELNHRQRAFESEQLPRLLQTISELNHRQLASDHDQNNLVKSVPVALRELTRNLNEMRQKLDGRIKAIEFLNEEGRLEFENMAKSVGDLSARVEFLSRVSMNELTTGIGDLVDDRACRGETNQDQ